LLGAWESEGPFVEPARTSGPGTAQIYPFQWHLHRQFAARAWELAPGLGSSVTVAVLDTGVTANPSLTGRLLPGADFIGGGSSQDDPGHGTHMAGILAGDAQAVGVAPADLRPEEPQSYRDLALILERRAQKVADGKKAAVVDYRRAIELLTHVVMNQWERFNEIEVMALTEVNHIIPKARKLGVDDLDLDSRLIKHLDMDVPIVMTWDADLTDMHMHVVEPSGEEAYYGHNKTKIGGIVSRDFTRGYGPEVYLLHRAMKGEYAIRTRYFGSSSAKLAGAVTLQIDVFTNYGCRNEQRKSLTLRLIENKETFMVGTIKI
jgi:hypothetical protein